MARRLEIEIAGDARDFERQADRAAQAVRGVERAADAADDDVRQFGDEVDRAGRRAQRTQRLISGLQSAFAGIGVVVGGAVIQGLRRFVTESADLGAGLVETASAAGATVQELQELRRAFEEDGAAAQQVDNALFLLNTSISRAAVQGLATYRDAFDRLGVTLRNEEGAIRTSGEILNELAGRVNAVNFLELQGDIAQLVGARGFAALLPALLRSQEEFQAARDRAAEFGVVVDEDANALKDLSQTLADFEQTLRTQIATAIGENQDAFEQLIRLALDAVQVLGRAVPTLRTLIEGAFPFLIPVPDLVDDFAASLANMNREAANDALADVASRLASVREALDAPAADRPALLETLGIEDDEVRRLVARIGELEDAQGSYFDTLRLGGALSVQSELRMAREALGEALEGLESELVTRSGQVQSRIAQIVADAGDAVAESVQFPPTIELPQIEIPVPDFGDANIDLTAFNATMNAYAQAAAAGRLETERFADDLGDFSTEVDQATVLAQQAFQSMFQSIRTTMSRLVDSIFRSTASIRDILGDLSRALLDIGINIALTRLETAIGNRLGLNPAAAGAGAPGASPTGGTAGVVTPETGRGGGVTIENHISINSTDGPGVRAALREAEPRIQQATTLGIQRLLGTNSELRHLVRQVGSGA